MRLQPAQSLDAPRAAEAGDVQPREQHESPELVAQHLEGEEAERGRGATGDLLEAGHDVPDDLGGLLDERRLTGNDLDSAHLTRNDRAEDEDSRADHHDDPGRRDCRGHPAERDPEDLHQAPARLGEPVALHQVLPSKHVGDRGRLHREDHSRNGLHDQEASDQARGGKDVPLRRPLAER